jgi:hypothetical protein
VLGPNPDHTCIEDRIRIKELGEHILETTEAHRKTRDWEQRIGNTYVTYGSGGAIR